MAAEAEAEAEAEAAAASEASYSDAALDMKSSHTAHTRWPARKAQAGGLSTRDVRRVQFRIAPRNPYSPNDPFVCHAQKRLFSMVAAVLTLL